MRTLPAIALTFVAALGLAGCGSDEPTATSSPDASTSSAAASDLPACTAADIKVVGKFGTKPEVTVPDTCSPPTKLVVKDLSVGTGPAAKAGSTVLTDYLLVTWSDKQVLDNSFDRGQPYPLQNLGQAQVIDGWNQGLIGIKQGSRRLLIVPPDLGYGQGGNGIQPNETLVFVVDAVKVS